MTLTTQHYTALDVPGYEGSWACQLPIDWVRVSSGGNDTMDTDDTDFVHKLHKPQVGQVRVHLLSVMISFFAFVDTFFELRRLLPGGRRFLRVWKHEQVKPKAVFASYLVYNLLTTMTS